MKYTHFGHSSNKTIQKEYCEVTFNFWLQGRPKTLPNARSSLALIGAGVSEKIFEHCERRTTTTDELCYEYPISSPMSQVKAQVS